MAILIFIRFKSSRVDYRRRKNCTKTRYFFKNTAEPSNQFLQQKYSEHFDGGLFKTIETVLFFTDIIDDKLKKKNKHYDFSEKSYKELRDKCQKVFYAFETNFQ